MNGDSLTFQTCSHKCVCGRSACPNVRTHGPSLGVCRHIVSQVFVPTFMANGVGLAVKANIFRPLVGGEIAVVGQKLHQKPHLAQMQEQCLRRFASHRHEHLIEDQMVGSVSWFHSEGVGLRPQSWQYRLFWSEFQMPLPACLLRLIFDRLAQPTCKLVATVLNFRFGTTRKTRCSRSVEVTLQRHR